MRALSVFKPLFVSLVLILVIEGLQIFSNTNYYPHKNTTAETLASVALVLVILSFFFFVFSIIASRILRAANFKGAKLVAIVEVVALAAMALVYAPAAVMIVKMNSTDAINFFWFFGFGIFPLLIILAVILFRAFFKESFKRFFNYLAGLLWRPGLVVLALSVIWAVLFIAVFAETKTKIRGEAVELTSLQKPEANVILITFDALSARDMSLYGYKRRTTPFWEEFAKKSYLFENMHSNYSVTVPAISSILTSKYPWTHGAHEWLEHIKSDMDENIASVIGENYFTAAIVPSMYQVPEFIGLKDQFDMTDWVGFDFPRDFGLTDFFSSHGISPYAIPIFRHFVFFKNDHIINASTNPFDAAVELLKKKKDSPVFLWLHLWPPHVPHNPPKHFKGVYLSADVNVEKFKGRYDELREKQVRDMRARYDELILYLDDSLRTFIGELKEVGAYDKSIVIISSDHGQIFEEGYSLVPSPLMYEQNFHIPLLIHLPGQTEGVRVKTLAEQIDLAPTILDLTGTVVPDWMEGESLVPYMRNPSLETKKTKYSMVFFYDDYTEVRWFAAYRGEFKLIYQMDTEAAALFKIKDAHSRENNLAMKEREVFMDLKRELTRKIEENYSDLERGRWRENE